MGDLLGSPHVEPLFYFIYLFISFFFLTFSTASTRLGLSVDI